MGIPNMARYPAPASIRRIDSPTNNFSQRISPATGRPYARGLHGGSDIKPHIHQRDGDPLYPAWPGRVIGVARSSQRSGVWGGSYGNRVLVRHYHRHSDGHGHLWYSFYAHLSRIDVKVNQLVSVGTRIGLMGHTGSVTATHCHYEVHTTDEWTKGLVDPYPFLNYRKRRGS